MRERPAVVHWRFAAAGGGGLPPVDRVEAWLAPAEQRRARAFRVPKRRDDWLAGRLNLKALVCDVFEARFHERPSPASVLIDRLSSGAPVARWADGDRAGDQDVARCSPGAESLPLSVSNSHSHGAALGAALWVDGFAASGWGAAVGTDLEWIEPRSDGFVRDFLTEPERRYCAAGGDERHLRANLLWSAKESVLKVLQVGLKADTWWVTCLPDEPGPAGSEPPEVEVAPQPDTGRWRPFHVSCDERLGAAGVRFGGVWRVIDGYVATIAVGLRRT